MTTANTTVQQPITREQVIEYLEAHGELMKQYTIGLPGITAKLAEFLERGGGQFIDPQAALEYLEAGLRASTACMLIPRLFHALMASVKEAA